MQLAIVTSELARTEPDSEIQDLIRASAGLNLALDYLPGSVGFDPLADKVDPDLASAIVWFDAYVSNVDRTPRNTNILMWHKRPWLIDHGAALYFHHRSDDFQDRAGDPFPLIKDHVLLRRAASLPDADTKLTDLITPAVIDGIVTLIPDIWLSQESSVVIRASESAGGHLFGAGEAARRAYLDYLVTRLESPRAFLEEAIRARSLYV